LAEECFHYILLITCLFPTNKFCKEHDFFQHISVNRENWKFSVHVAELWALVQDYIII